MYVLNNRFRERERTCTHTHIQTYFSTYIHLQVNREREREIERDYTNINIYNNNKQYTLEDNVSQTDSVCWSVSTVYTVQYMCHTALQYQQYIQYSTCVTLPYTV